MLLRNCSNLFGSPLDPSMSLWALLLAFLNSNLMVLSVNRTKTLHQHHCSYRLAFVIELTVNFLHFVGVILVDDLLIDKILILICENTLVGHRTDPFATLRFGRHIFPTELTAIASMLEQKNQINRNRIRLETECFSLAQSAHNKSTFFLG